MIERVLTIGAYGFNERTFVEALKAAGADLFIDIRARRGMRGSAYAFANATRLQASLEAAGIKYTHAGGTIQVRGDEVEGRLVIEVEDECGGLSPDAELALFKPYEQHAENRKGLGLGLTIALRAIALNAGTLTCQNLLGKGCVFKIDLPLPKPAAPSAPGDQ